MCGIAGAFAIDGRSGEPLERHVLQRMTEVIEHRGPDDAGFVLGDGVALGARRLSIVDVEGGHQPLSDERGRVWGAQNGEIYNHDALRAELQASGHRFRSRCDTEVLPHLYEAHGPQLCERLHGKYAVAVWDAGTRRGLLARDRLGVKPLYYAKVGGLVVFGSELKCVIASGLVSDTLDLEAIAAYLSVGYVPGPMTPLRDVRKVMPGERLVVGDGEVRHERYWTYPAPDPEPGLGVEEWSERLLGELDEAVRMRLMSDVPLGAMLSGGLDSSVIVALMARHMREPVKTFAIGFRGVGEASELGDARRVAQALGADHHEIELPLTAELGALERLAWHMDEPVRSLSALGFLALSELAASKVTVALSGQGADELFAGYRKHRVMSVAGTWQRMPAALRAPLAAIAARGPGDIPRLASALQSPDPVSRLLASSGLVRPELRAELFSGALAEHADAARRAAGAHLNGAASATPLAAGLYLDAQLGLVDDMLHYFDRASMAHSLEVRVPFLDHRLVETAARMPDAVKVRRGETKHVLRTAARGLVPDFVLDKRKLGFFAASTSQWLGAGDGAIVDEVLLGSDPRYAEVVEQPVIERVVADWRTGVDHTQFLLAVVMLELWLSRYLPRAFAQARSAAGPERDYDVAVPVSS
jgi:asparagine synthase (glutamine-hydrolysing)